MTSVAMKVRVTGRVQGVAYRNWARARAGKLGLTGWVQNDVSGAVLARLEGEKSTVEKMVSEMWAGPAAASVRDVQSHRAKALSNAPSFEIRP